MNRGGMTLLLAVALLLFRCTQSPVSGGGGASETVASVTPYEQGLQVSVTGDGTFSVQAAVYHSAYTAADTGHFNSTSRLTNNAAEWPLQYLADSEFIVFVLDTVNRTGAAFRYDNRADSPRGRQTKMLSALGGITGNVTVRSMESGDTIVPVGERVVVAGSAFSAIVGEDGTYRLSGLPEAGYEVRLAIQLKQYTRIGPDDTVAVSGDRISTFDLHVDN